MTAVFFGGCLVVTLFLSVSVHIDAPHDSHGACSYLVFKGGVRDRVVDGRISLLWIFPAIFSLSLYGDHVSVHHLTVIYIWIEAHSTGSKVRNENDSQSEGVSEGGVSIQMHYSEKYTLHT
ncbi:hypothetical protein BO86DRAFT_220374 [Aspergillus japonicus CBS 114.51]|uniref:Uncharacterized protein n=1 Tax=Aspergillus japonicus CBS 114.51 TaxID=1448312 RepID=A0A8T8WNS2_ASPJA|nr:hypothetical protein BO86DRAFT_220374 [Aspergillus japonicus CBS 114.51]RAH77447.1 hypothetical protein BO86DRAFT_220374 [Aspergillus japonicus CBS 114.51]